MKERDVERERERDKKNLLSLCFFKERRRRER
jgi:hypothetical protein